LKPLNWLNKRCKMVSDKLLACNMLRISARTLQRWDKSKDLTDGRTTVIKQPGNALRKL